MKRKFFASSFFDDVVEVLAQKAGYQPYTDVPSAEVIEAVLAKRGIQRDDLGVSSRKDKKPRAVLLVEWAFRNQREEHKSSRRQTLCIQGAKRGAWALTPLGVLKGHKIAGEPPIPEPPPTPEPPPSDPPEYTPEELRRGADRTRQLWHELVHHAGMADVLKPPVFELMLRQRNWGFWNPGSRVFAIHARIAIRFGYTHWMRDTVAHELAHQYVSEVVQPQAETWVETAHGPTWKSACKIFGADPKATVLDSLDSLCTSTNTRDDKILRRVQKLLALSNSPEEHEAELAALKAREMMYKYNLSEMEAKGQRRWDYRVLGKPRKQRPGWLTKISRILVQFYSVEAIWIPSFHPNVPEESTELNVQGRQQSSVLEITGTPSNVAVAEHVYYFLLAEGKRRLALFRENGGGTDMTSRLDFLEGLYLGFQTKLATQTRKLRKTYVGSTALVLQEDAELTAFYRARYPHIKSIANHGRYTCNAAARAEGIQQGQQMTIRESIEGSTQRGLALPSH